MKAHIYNHGDRDVVTYHLPLLIGDVGTFLGDGTILVWNSSLRENRPVFWPVVEGCFKALVHLRRGENVVTFKFDKDESTLTLIFHEADVPNFVRPVYIICADSDGRFQGPEDEEDCSPASACKRILIGAQLIQSFTAEKLREHGFERHAFRLETDSSGQPLCHVFRSRLKLKDAQKLSGHDLWTYFGKELMTSSKFSKRDKCKWYCFMSFTRYKPPQGSIPKTHSEILKYTKGHTALGGGGLALFGTGNMHTWASSLEEVVKRFTDTRKMDRTKFMDDSAYREYYWANYATGLGASLHELGHTFDLAHTPTGIMARGFDDLHKVFLVQRSKVTSRTTDSRQDQSSYNRDSVPRTLSDGELSRIGKLTLESHARRYRDVCYDTPVKRKMKQSSSYCGPPPLMVKTESNFQPMRSPSLLTICVKNYDGSQTTRTISHEDGFENVTEVTMKEDGSLLAHTTQRKRSCSTCSTSSTLSNSSISPPPSTLPNSPEDDVNENADDSEATSTLGFPHLPIHYADDGAHWFRASAMLLRYHKWFNKPQTNDPRKPPEISKGKVRAVPGAGLRLIELRSDPEGMVFHHWEFLQTSPPSEFILKLSKINNLPENAVAFTVLAEDNFGNIAKRKIKISDISR